MSLVNEKQSVVPCFKTTESRRYRRDVMFLQAPVTQIYRVRLYDSEGCLVRSYSDSECSKAQVESRVKERYPDLTADISEIE